MPVVRKSEFAKLCNVTKGLVSQWIAKGYISDSALVGEGRTARIDVDLARAQLIERRAVNESCGLNGLNTKLGPDAPSEAPSDAAKAPSNATGAAPTPRPPAPEARESEDPATVDARIKAEKLKQNEILTRKLRTEERARDGIYMDAAGARGTMGRIASEMLKLFEGALPCVVVADKGITRANN